MPWDKIAPGIWTGQARLQSGCVDWYVIVQRADYANGRRRYRRVGPDRELAVRLATELAERLAAAGSENLLVSEVLRRFERDHVPTLRRRTRRLYEGVIDKHLAPALGGKIAGDLRGADFFRFGQTFLESVEPEKRPKRLALLGNCYTVLRSALNWYWNEHELETPCPARLISHQAEKVRRHMELNPPEKRRYTANELAILLRIAAEKRPTVHDLFMLGGGAGLRFGECLGVEWEHVDWFGGTVRTVYQIDDRGVPTLLKSADRRLPMRLAEPVLATLRRRFEERTSDRWVFATKRGRPYRARNVQRWIHEIRELAAQEGVPMEATFHSSRHTWATAAVNAGWDWETIRNQLGHHSAAFTAKQYVHAAPRSDLDPDLGVVTLVTNQSRRSQEGSDESRNPLNLERETGLEPATLSLGSKSRASDSGDLH